LTQVATSADVAFWPSIEQSQPNCEHQACWLSAIALYASDEVVTRVPVDAHAVNIAHSRTASELRSEMRFMVRHLSFSMASGRPGLHG
jgi:hypothetical protein